MDATTWSMIGYLVIGGVIGTIITVPITIGLNEYYYWRQCKRNGWYHEWLMLDAMIKKVKKH